MSLDRYIEHVIKDLQEAKKNVPPDPELEKITDQEEFNEKMFAIETAPDVPPKKLFGVSYEELPAPEKLTDAQMLKLLDAIEDTFATFNIGISKIYNIPTKLLYEVVRDYFKEDIHYMPGFSMMLDFCSGWCEDCKIADYCDTKDEFMNEEISNMDDFDYDSDELPF